MAVFFSIITPTWNSGIYLKETVESVFSQSCSEWEWLIADDNSSDGTREYLRDLAQKDTRVKLFELSSTNNPARSRNICINNSLGKVICLLDHDDLWDKTYLDKIRLAYNDHTVTCTFSRHFFYKNDQLLPAPTYFNVGGVVQSGELTRQLFTQNRIAFSAFTVDAQFIKRIGLLDESSDVWGSCDYEIYLRILKNGGKFHFLNEFLVKYRVLVSSMTSFHARNIHNRIHVAEKMIKEPSFSEYHKEIEFFLAKCRFQLSVSNFISEQPNWRLNLIRNATNYYGISRPVKLIKWLILAVVPIQFSKLIIKRGRKKLI
jgi:teichuronic acid biosynthesis glycosyltransferase TuaG